MGQGAGAGGRRQEAWGKRHGTGGTTVAYEQCPKKLVVLFGISYEG